MYEVHSTGFIEMLPVFECIFRTEIYSTHAWKVDSISMDNISTESLLNAVKNILCCEIEVGIYKKFAKM